MSKEELILAACEGKQRQTRQAAKALAKKQRRKKGAAVEAYRCPHCGFWHIGAIEKKPARSEPPDGRTVKPTPERRKKGEWVWVAMGKNEPKAARDMKSHPIDAMSYTRTISHQQASAAYDYEAAYRAALQTPQARDSTTLWEPKGHESDDGNVDAVEKYRKLCRHLGMVRERQMQVVCIEGYMPKRHEIGEFRETCNEVARFFGYA